MITATSYWRHWRNLLLLTGAMGFAVGANMLWHRTARTRSELWLGRLYASSMNFEGPFVEFGVKDLDIPEFTARKLYPAMPHTNFSAEFFACIDMTTSAAISLTLGSDDGAWLHIDNDLVLDVGGSHSFLEKQRVVHLERGAHLIKIRYFQGQAQAGLVFKVDNSISPQFQNGRLRRPQLVAGSFTCPF